MSIIAVPQAISAVAAEGSFKIRRAQGALTTVAGVSQVTTFSDRRWRAQVRVKPRSGANLRLWSLFMTQLSDIENVFALAPPHYDGPSTGYAGAGPLVAGADQLGLALDVDTLGLSAAVLLKGDFISFDVTSPGGDTNRQLIQVAADVTSDGAGAVTIALTTPIRQAPANNAAVEIFSPTALFSFETPEGGVEIDTNLMSEFIMDVIERIFP